MGRKGPNTPRKRVILMKATKVIALLLIVLLVVAVAASAQAPRQKGQHARAMAAADQGAAAATPDQRRAHAAAMASLVRILFPPRPEQLAKVGIGMSLTDDQKAQIKTLYETFGAAVKAVAPARGEALKGVLTGIQQPSPNKADLQAGAAKVLDGDKAILDAEFDFWIGLKGVLGAQGSSAVSSFLQNKAMGEMSGGRGGPGGPPPQQ